MRLIPFRGPKKRIKKVEKFVDEWRDLQAMCRDKSNWADALVRADKLLDKALKKRRFKGKTMGERLVEAQRFFNDNDDVWFAHNLAKKVAGDTEIKLKETDVKDALLGFRDALKDIGALQFANKDNNETAGKNT